MRGALHKVGVTIEKVHVSYLSKVLRNLQSRSYSCATHRKNHGERQVTAVMKHVFDAGCSPSGSTSSEARGLMVDIGANTGAYGLLALHTGE